MSINRWDAKRDANENALVALAEQIGARWVQAPPLDGWVGWRGKWFPCEIKDPSREGHKDEFTAKQITFRARAKLAGLPFWTWRTERDVLESLGARVSA